MTLYLPQMKTHLIREFIEESSNYTNMKIKWTGDNINEKDRFIYR